MATQVGIINLALTNIAQKPIVSIAENSVSAITAMRVWDSCLQETLRGHDWSFATVILPLTLVSSIDDVAPVYTVPNGWTYAYEYPASCMAMWHVYNDLTVDTSIGEKFREIYDSVNAKKRILSNCEDAIGEYTFLVTDPTLFDSNFVTTLSYRLAAALAYPLTGNEELAKTMITIFNSQMSEAERMSSYENNKSEIDQEQASDIISSRG